MDSVRCNSKSDHCCNSTGRDFMVSNYESGHPTFKVSPSFQNFRALVIGERLWRQKFRLDPQAQVPLIVEYHQNALSYFCGNDQICNFNGQSSREVVLWYQNTIGTRAGSEWNVPALYPLPVHRIPPGYTRFKNPKRVREWWLYETRPTVTVIY